MDFDVDQFRAPWSFTLAGRTYVARRVSVEQVTRFAEAFVGPAPDPATAPHQAKRVELRQRGALIRLLRVAYPWRLSYGWRRDRDPVRLLLALDAPTQQALLESFFDYAGRRTPPPSPPIPGTPTSPPM